MLKALFLLDVFKFLSCVFVEIELERKLKLISKLMTSQTGKQIIRINLES